MRRRLLLKSETIENGGFSWHYWPNKRATDKTIIVALGGATDTGVITRAAIKYVHAVGCNAVTFIPALDGKPYDGWEVEKQYPKECRAAREEIDRICLAAIEGWQA